MPAEVGGEQAPAGVWAHQTGQADADPHDLVAGDSGPSRQGPYGVYDRFEGQVWVVGGREGYAGDLRPSPSARTMCCIHTTLRMVSSQVSRWVLAFELLADVRGPARWDAGCRLAAYPVAATRLDGVAVQRGASSAGADRTGTKRDPRYAPPNQPHPLVVTVVLGKRRGVATGLAFERRPIVRPCGAHRRRS